MTAVGLNFYGHFKIDHLEDFHKIGDALAPKNIWRRIFEGDDVNVGMQDVTVVVHPAPRNKIPSTQNAKRISVQPSGQIRQGVYFLFNDHHEVKPKQDDELLPAEIAASIVETYWESVCKNLAPTNSGFGCVRLRKKIGESGWREELFGNAGRI